MDLSWLFANVPLSMDTSDAPFALPSPIASGLPHLPPHAPSPPHQHVSMKPPRSTGASTTCSALVTTGGNANTRTRSRTKPPPLTLADVERQIVAAHGALPADTKRRLARAELKRLKHCETVRQSRVRKKVLLYYKSVGMLYLYSVYTDIEQQNQRTDLRQVHAELEQELTVRLAQYRAAHDWMDFDERRARDVLFKRFVHSIYEVRALRRERGELAERIAEFDALGEQLQRLQGDYQVGHSHPTRPTW